MNFFCRYSDGNEYEFDPLITDHSYSFRSQTLHRVCDRCFYRLETNR